MVNPNFSNKSLIILIAIIFSVLAVILILTEFLPLSSKTADSPVKNQNLPIVEDQYRKVRNQYSCLYYPVDYGLVTLSADSGAVGFSELRNFCQNLPNCEWRAIHNNNYTCCPTDMDDYDNFRKNLKNLKYPENVYRRCTAIIY